MCINSCASLDQTAHSQVFLDDDICHKSATATRVTFERLTVDGTHDESDLCCISRTGEVCVDLLSLCLVERDKAVENVVACCGIIGTTCAMSAFIGTDQRFDGPS
jgi:hypothetical protein